MAKTPSHHLQVLSTKSFQSPSPNNSTLTLTKIKSVIHTVVVSSVCRIAHVLTKLKSVFIEMVKDTRVPLHLIYRTKEAKMKYKNKKILFGSFRLHYNWCSSHVLPVQESLNHFYYDPTWHSITTSNGEVFEDGTTTGESHELSGYLQWLEEVHENNNNNSDNISMSNGVDNVSVNEIDHLADLFIANCHEKFRLEKQESYRRFQEMMATRSIY